ncbi:N-chimaerin-like isoform X2 [Tubulanus polymorphus]|uniref:N-chimaerin-like isoform X2 n=1 Tax=Tubulanus polymorphus TaxID=672921 RepID=UPI003DA200B0
MATGRSSPVGTGRSSPMATGRSSPVATGRTSPVATGRSSPVATGRLSPLVTGRLSPLVTRAKATGRSSPIMGVKSLVTHHGETSGSHLSTLPTTKSPILNLRIRDTTHHIGYNRSHSDNEILTSIVEDESNPVYDKCWSADIEKTWEQKMERLPGNIIRMMRQHSQRLLQCICKVKDCPVHRCRDDHYRRLSSYSDCPLHSPLSTSSSSSSVFTSETSLDQLGMDDDCVMPIWKSYLYHLQMQAPKPKRVVCRRDLGSRVPFQYGREFHGAISREETDSLLSECDGCYLVRESQRAPGTYTLAIRFEAITKNFKLFYDGQHYVGEKRFDTIHDLVADGLITFYLESKASDYIEALSKESNYEESPYYRNKYRKQRELLIRSPQIYEGIGVKGSYERDAAVLRGDTTDSSPKEDKMPIDVTKYKKPHNFKVHTFKGPHWCEFCANFMWGLIAQGVKCQDCGFNAHKKCSEKVPNDCIPAMKYVKRVFCVDLTTLVKAENSPIPVVVEKCVKEIEARGVEAEGLYRVAGFHDDVETLKLAFDKDGENADISESKYEDINTITSLLKSFFRELPIPLITFDAYPYFMEAVQKDYMDQDERLQKIYHAMSLLPPAHLNTLRYFLSHLQRVAAKHRINMMSFENLAIVFAPTLLRSPSTDPLAGLTYAKFERSLIELMIAHQDILFQ